MEFSGREKTSETQSVELLDAVISAPAAAAYPRALNAVRLLTRLLPILFEEGDGEDDDAEGGGAGGADAGGADAAAPVSDQFVRRLFWDNQLPRVLPASAVDAADGGAAAGAGAGAEEEEEDAYVMVWEPRAGSDDAYPLGMQLAHCAMACLFLPDLTVDRGQYHLFVSKLAAARARGEELAAAASASAAAVAAGTAKADGEKAGSEPDQPAGGDDIVPDEANAVWPMLLWSGGVGFPKLVPPTSSARVAPRVDVLRLLVALSSQPLYSPPSPGASHRSRFLDELTSTGCPFAPTAFYALLNTVLGYDPVGYGVPYASALLGDGDEPLVAASLHALLVLLDYSPPGAGDDGAGGEGEDAAFNIYRSMLAGLSDPLDCDILFGGITRLLANVPAADGTLLPFAMHQIGCYSELLVLLWKTLDENTAFLTHMLTACDVSSAVAPICYLMWAGRADVSRVGLVHLCTFMLLLLSGNREFGVGLNKPFLGTTAATRRALPADTLPPFDGSHADLLIATLHKLVVDGLPALESLYSCFLTVIANISPYTKGLSLVASVKLLNLLELFAAPRFLFARSGNYTFAATLLETLNNLVQYQYEANPLLVYALLRRADVLRRLAGLSLDSWHGRRALAPGAGGAPASPSARARPLQLADAPTATPPALPAARRSSVGLEAPSEGALDDSEWVRRHAVGETEAQAGAGAAAAEGATDAPPAVANAAVVAPSDAAAAADDDSAAAAAAATAAEVAAGSSDAPAADAIVPARLSPPPPPPALRAAWEPTEAWVEGTVKKALPLGTLLRLVGYLTPLVERHVTAVGGDDDAVVDFIRASTVVGVLPQPHPLVHRVYTPNSYTALWLTTFTWSTVYLAAARDLPLFDASAIRLFQITVA